jgi:hypothetical protein
MKFQVLFACRMSTMMNYRAAATNQLNNLPASEGMIFFGSFAVPTSEVLKFSAPAPLTEQSEQETLGSITEEETEGDNEICYYLTPKGQDGKTFALPAKTKRPKRRSQKKPARVNHAMAPFNKKRSLQSYQDELVAEPDLPTHNSFSPLRIVRRNSSTAHIRATGEIPRTIPFVHKPRRMTLKPNPKTVEDTTIRAIHKAHNQLRTLKQRRNRYYTSPAPRTSAPVDAKVQLTYPVQILKRPKPNVPVHKPAISIHKAFFPSQRAGGI